MKKQPQQKNRLFTLDHSWAMNNFSVAMEAKKKNHWLIKILLEVDDHALLIKLFVLVSMYKIAQNWKEMHKIVQAQKLNINIINGVQ